MRNKIELKSFLRGLEHLYQDEGCTEFKVKKEIGYLSFEKREWVTPKIIAWIEWLVETTELSLKEYVLDNYWGEIIITLKINGSFNTSGLDNEIAAYIVKHVKNKLANTVLKNCPAVFDYGISSAPGRSSFYGRRFCDPIKKSFSEKKLREVCRKVRLIALKEIKVEIEKVAVITRIDKALLRLPHQVYVEYQWKQVCERFHNYDDDKALKARLDKILRDTMGTVKAEGKTIDWFT